MTIEGEELLLPCLCEPVEGKQVAMDPHIGGLSRSERQAEIAAEASL